MTGGSGQLGVLDAWGSGRLSPGGSGRLELLDNYTFRTHCKLLDGWCLSGLQVTSRNKWSSGRSETFWTESVPRTELLLNISTMSTDSLPEDW